MVSGRVAHLRVRERVVRLTPGAITTFIAYADFGWFSHFRHRAGSPDEVNLWRLSLHDFEAMLVDALFFFRLGEPHKAIGGCGFFALNECVPLRLAWESFGNVLDDFHDGRECEQYVDRSILLPQAASDRPDPELLEWHGAEVFRG